MGGSDDPSNLISLSVEDHAEAHRLLYESHGCWQDFLAWHTAAANGDAVRGECLTGERRAIALVGNDREI